MCNMYWVYKQRVINGKMIRFDKILNDVWYNSILYAVQVIVHEKGNWYVCVVTQLMCDVDMHMTGDNGIKWIC